MATPTPSWNTVRVFGTWRNMDGTLKAGTAKIVLPARITDVTDDDIIPAGTFVTTPLQIANGALPSLDVMVPATDDPDIEQTDWTVQITVTFDDKSLTENYSITVPYANRPVADGGNDLGVDLRTVAVATSLPQSNPQYKVGVPGGLAQLDQNGDVVDANGDPVTGSGGDVAGDTHAATSKATPVDADEIPLADSAATFLLKKLTWANLKAAVKAYLDGVGVAKLSTARTINGVSFDGTANITVADSTKVPTTRLVNGHPLSADVVVSASDITTGTLPAAQLPAIAVVDYLGAAASQAAMLALTGQKGDWCTRTDLGTTWLITGTDPTQLTSWTQLSYPTAPVTSVAGKTGAVTLAKADVGLGSVDNTADASKSVASAAKLTTARTIAGHNFDGTANISITNSDVGAMGYCIEAAGTYPARPASTAPVTFVGPDAPAGGGTTAGGAGAVNGLDIWFQTAS